MSTGSAPSIENAEPPEAGLSGKRVLIAEDEFLLAVMLEEDLRSAGCIIVDPFRRPLQRDAGRIRGKIRLAVLDVSLNGERVFSLAEKLSARSVPFVFLSGYGAGDLPEEFRNSPRLETVRHPGHDQ